MRSLWGSPVSELERGHSMRRDGSPLPWPSSWPFRPCFTTDTPKRLPLMGSVMSSRPPTPRLRPDTAMSSPAAKTERGTMAVAMFRHPDAPSASRYPRRSSSAQCETSLPPLPHLPSHCRVTCRSGCGLPRSPRSPKRALPFWFVRSTISNPRSHGHENQRAQCIYRHASFWRPPRSVLPSAPPHP